MKNGADAIVIILNEHPMDMKYKEGEEVYDRIRPGQTLIISRYFRGIYYCKVAENPQRKELIYFERELMTRGSA